MQSPPDCRFASKTGTFFLRMPDGRWQNLPKHEVKLHYTKSGFPVSSPHKSGCGLTNFEHAMILIQENLAVDYAGPIAGYKSGMLPGRKILVTSEARPVEPKRGECPNFDLFLAQLLGNGSQSQFFLLWLKMALQTLAEGSFRPGQMLVLAGPSGCGKSLLQALITALLGGRMAKPYLWMVEKTAFNSHLAGAEHLVIADENASLDLRSRRAFGSKIKDLTVNREMSIHAKGQDISVCLPTFRRLTLSVNDEPENLAIAPPMDESLMDKMALLRCSKAEVGSNPIQIWAKFEPEFPAICWRLEKLKIPKAWQDDRYGVKAYHNQDLLDVLGEISPEVRLLNLIDEVVFAEKNIRDTWKGNSMELEKTLRCSEFGFAVDKLLSFGGACGTYLSRLKSKFPNRFESKKNGGKTVWTITK